MLKNMDLLELYDGWDVGARLIGKVDFERGMDTIVPSKHSTLGLRQEAYE